MGKGMREIAAVATELVTEATPAADPVQQLPGEGELALGQWYWVLPEKEDEEEPEDGATEDLQGESGLVIAGGNPDDDGSDEPEDRGAPAKGASLACVMKIGSNFCELRQPTVQGERIHRVHLNDFWTQLIREPHPERYIGGQIGHWRNEVSRLVGELNKLSERLGLSELRALPGAGRAPGATGGSELMVLSGQIDPKSYKRALALAKDEKLPQLHKEIEHATQQMSRWMLASTYEVRASITPMEDTIKAVDSRIHSVGLYAGLSEEAMCFHEGATAPATEKLHVMQRLLYMDEEALLDYHAGGMEFKSIGKFCKWLAKPANRDRILPFPRTLVAMRVRRQQKEREWDGTLRHLGVMVDLAAQDQYTFLFVRNGDQLWRIACNMEFGEMIFPDQSLAPDEPLMVKMWGLSTVEKLMTVREFEHLKEQDDEREAVARRWAKAHPGSHDWDNPHRRPHFGFSPDDWKPVTPEYLYYDEVMEHIQDKIREFNRVAVIIQGLFDRSTVLHPHPPVRSWTAQGFEAAITLIYDANNVLNYGEPPDFEAYRAQCNATLGAGCVTTGQERAWLLREGKKESERMDRDWRTRSRDHRPTTFRPYNDPGPGFLAQVAAWRPRTAEALFEWERKSKRVSQWETDPIRTTLTVPAASLLNVSAYKPGDFKLFFRDPRTRQHYLQWAPLLLAAEDFHAGKRKLGDPS